MTDRRRGSDGSGAVDRSTPGTAVELHADADTRTPPKVSVIMIFLDADRYIDEAIQSVMLQSLRDLELLLCDDGSTDGSTALARRWASRHPEQIRYLEHDGHVNRGMSATRNLGLSAVRGEYVAFIDADDVWRPAKLAEQIALMEAHPDLGMVCGTVRYWASWEGGEDRLVPTGHVQDRVVQPPEASLALYPLGDAAAPCPSDMLLRRTAVESVGRFEEEFRGLYEDQAFLAKLYLAWPVYFSSSVWLDYRQHSDSCTIGAAREGRYDVARQAFLTWFAAYLAGLPVQPPPAVRRSLRRALFAYRRPGVHAALASGKRLLRRGRSAGRRLVHVGARRNRRAMRAEGQ